MRMSVDAGRHGLLDHVLDPRLVDQGDHLLGRRLGRRQEAGAEPRGGDHCLADTHGSTVRTRSRRPRRRVVPCATTPGAGTEHTTAGRDTTQGDARRGRGGQAGERLALALSGRECQRRCSGPSASRSTRPRRSGTMPTYVYKFVDTGETIEVQQSFDEPTLTEAPHPADGQPRPVQEGVHPRRHHVQGQRLLQDRQPGSKSGLVVVGLEVDGLRRRRPSSSSELLVDSSELRRARPGRRRRAAARPRRRPAAAPGPARARAPAPAPAATRTDVAGPAAAAAEVGVFGGSGFYEFLDDVTEVELDTPYGAPSAPVTIGTVGRPSGRLPPPPRAPATSSSPPPSPTGPTCGRCGSSACAASWRRAPPARCSPSCTRATSSSLDQLVDRTWGRADTYHDGAPAHHESFADPYDDGSATPCSRPAGPAGSPCTTAGPSS